MKAPGFWYNPPERPGILSRLLSPLGSLRAVATRRSVARTDPYRPGIPVICLGNIDAGGTGKTPAIIAIVSHLQNFGADPHVLSRGDGGTIEGPVEVEDRTHTAAEVGDEPLLASAFAPTWVACDHAAGARMAESEGAEVIVLVGEFHNPSLINSISIIVVDARRGFGNGRCIPAGPLREPVKAGLARADLILTIGSPEEQERFTATWSRYIRIPHLVGDLKPLETGMDWTGTPFLAFAGIGHPEKFFATLRGLGADIVRSEALDDHQALTPTLMARLEREAGQLGAQLVTTEKDAVRLPYAFRRKVVTLPVRLEIDDWGPLDAALLSAGIT